LPPALSSSFAHLSRMHGRSALHLSAAQFTSARQPAVGSPIASQVDSSAQASASVMHFAAPHFSHSVSRPMAQVPPPVAAEDVDIPPLLALALEADVVIPVAPVLDVADEVSPPSSPPQPTAIASEVTPAATRVPMSVMFMCSASKRRYHTDTHFDGETTRRCCAIASRDGAVGGASPQQVVQPQPIPVGSSLHTSNSPMHTESPMHSQVGFPLQAGGTTTQWWTCPALVLSVTHTSPLGAHFEQSET